jgi:acid phosphatase (class A)
MMFPRFALLLLMPLAPALAQSTPETAMSASAVPGYLPGEVALAAARLLPPPPTPGSPADIADRYGYAASAGGIDTPAWKAAIEQLEIRSETFQRGLACAIGKRPGPATTRLLGRAAADFVPPMAEAKARFARERPFTTDRGQACDPVTADGVGESLGKAYPSGHAGIGWLWALILSQANPARAEAIRAFGKRTGDLRAVCRVHWLSDVENGRLLAAALYQQQQREPAFAADLAAAREELQAADDLDCG